MKRLFACFLIALMLFSMIGCELITPSPDVTSDIVTTDAVSTDTTEVSINDTTSVTTEAPVNDLVSGTNLTLTQFGMTFTIDYATLNDTQPIIGITVTNNTDNVISIQSSNCTINGLGVASIFGLTVPAHSTVSGTMIFNDNELVEYEIYSIKFIEFTYRIYDMNADNDTIIDTAIVELIF